MLYETHSHTPLCKHAEGEPEEYAVAAAQRGLKALTVTCHNPMPGGFASHVRMDPEQFDDYLALVERARAACDGQMDVLLGLEADYFPGHEAWLERQLNSADFQYVLGSVHPQLPEFRAAFWSTNLREVQRTYFHLLAEAAETELFDCLAHPDLVKNVTHKAWDEAQVLDDVRRSLDRIAVTGIAMELNTSGVNKTIPQMNPFPAMLREMRTRGIPVVIGADAHHPERVGDGFLAALQVLSECGYSKVSLFRDRHRFDVSIENARDALRKHEAIAGA